MGWFSRKAKKPEAEAKRRKYDAAKNNRLSLGFLTSSTSSTSEIKGGLVAIRSRCRDLERNNGWARRFLSMMEANVVGERGIVLQSQAEMRRPGNPDTTTRNLIERAWKRWGKNKQISVDQRIAWWAIERLVARTVPRDGEIFIRLLRDPGAPMGLRLQVIEADFVPVDKNETARNGNQVIMGIEVDRYNAPVAYYIASDHPADTYRARMYERVPADQILHIYVMERPGQVRGVPWLASAVMDAYTLGQYLDALVTRARVEASKMGFVTQDAEALGYAEDKETDSDGAVISAVEPGIIEILQPGQDFKAFDPSSTSGAGEFVTVILRRLAGGLGVNYNNLAGDFERVNFSSLRKATLEEQDQWKIIQRWLSDSLHQPIFDVWLEQAILTGNLARLGFDDLDRISMVEWQARRWPWVDPLKEVSAQVAAINAGIASRVEIIRERGRDPDVVTEEIENDPIKASAPVEPAPMPVDDIEDDETETDNGESNGNPQTGTG